MAVVMVDEARPLVADVPVPLLGVRRRDEQSCKGKHEKSVNRSHPARKCAGPYRTGAQSLPLREGCAGRARGRLAPLLQGERDCASAPARLCPLFTDCRAAMLAAVVILQRRM